MFIQEMLQQVQAQLEKAQVTAVRSVDDFDPVVSFGQRTQMNDPDVSQASGDHEPSQAPRVRDMALVQVEASAFLVGEEGFDAESLGVPVASFFHQFHIGDEVERLFISH